MARVYLVLALLLAAFWVYSIVDCAVQSPTRHRGVSKPIWLLIVILLPVVGPHAGPLLAMLIGVNIGPNLTWVGSLATLLWRQVLTKSGIRTTTREFTALGLLTVPVSLALAVVALWLAL